MLKNGQITRRDSKSIYLPDNQTLNPTIDTIYLKFKKNGAENAILSNHSHWLQPTSHMTDYKILIFK